MKACTRLSNRSSLSKTNPPIKIINAYPESPNIMSFNMCFFGGATLPAADRLEYDPELFPLGLVLYPPPLKPPPAP